MTEQADAVQGVAQFTELFVDEGADPASLVAVQEIVDRRTMAFADSVVCLFVFGIPPLGKPCALEELIRY